ncbi:MAG: M50 family metallopeptidase [Dehalococcoidales bacterium]|jgi:regulator of sigma E protease|nr:M50 family metallopeptidase [Dehalococcoidales bacterium]
MTLLISVVSFLAVIVVLVIAHELGHFATAKARGVTVQEFGLFYPPRLFSIKRSDTVYSLNTIPLGGFVKMAGEEDPEVAGSLASKGYSTRLLVLTAGSLMNFLLPVLLFSIAFMVPHNVVSGEVIVQEIAPNSPASTAGIRPGDTILSVNGKTISNGGDVSRYLQLGLGEEVPMLMRHSDATTETVLVTPRWNPPAGQGAVGILIGSPDAVSVRQSSPFWRAIPLGVVSCIETFILFKNGIFSMFIGTAPVVLAGPVGIAQLTGEVARAGISPLLEFAAFLSINLAIINMFPLPALDGGRVVFVLLEWLRRGKRVPPKAESLVHLFGFGMLMAFFLAITYQDIMRIINGQSLIP